MTSRTEAAQRNRELMPNVARELDLFRAAFGPDIKVTYAVDLVTGHTVGKPSDKPWCPLSPVDEPIIEQRSQRRSQRRR